MPTSFTPAAQFSDMSARAASQVIAVYSSSFSLATCLFPQRIRQDIRNLYAVVRIADEIVDGAVEGHRAELLDGYERIILAAPEHSFHTDPIVHAYACTARECSIDPAHMRAFFRSMRMDLDRVDHDEDSLEQYIYGSAEVIGLMCLAIFLKGHHRSEADVRTMSHGARALGAALQRINFLRDAGEDVHHLGRSYFPDGIDEDTKAATIQQIRAELAVAESSVELLPWDARLGVRTAMGIFTELTDRIDVVPAEDIHKKRVRVPSTSKARIAAGVMGNGIMSRIQRSE